MYGEVSSASNCTSYQSRRLNINFVGDHNTKTLVHTVNGTALAVPRIVLCLLETGWDEKTQTVSIPKCLHNFLPFDRIEKHRSSISLQ
jgi:seryl-tRNA synthetase